MANRIEDTDYIPSQGFATLTSRYADGAIVYYTDQRYLTYKIYKREPIPQSDNDQYTVIPAGMEYRPDLMSQNVYGIPDLWWRILEANNMSDVWDFKTGLNIRIPTTII